MKKLLLSLAAFFIAFAAMAQIPSGYYDGTEGLSGDALKQKLREIITNGHKTNGYDDLYDYYESTDKFPGTNKVWDMYSMDANGNADYYFYFGQGQECGTYSAEGDCYNREHSIPSSWFGKDYPMYADLFIVYPTDGYVNNRRSAYPYGETDGETFVSSNGSKLGSCTFPGYSGTVFEPIDEYKGDFARTYFYAVTRYDVSSWSGESFSGDGLSDWALQLFLKWNEEDPVSQKEIDRNNAVYQIQGNRNPYIDHPEWVQCVFQNQCASFRFTSSPVTQVNIGETYTYNITFEADDANATLTITAVSKPSWLTLTQNDNTSATLTGSTTQTGNYEVSLELSDGSETQLQNFTISVIDPSTQPILLLDEDFSSCPSDWTTYSVASNKDWECSTSGYLYINAFGGDVASEDWYISPALNLDEYSNEILTFSAYTKYSDDNIADPEVRLYYSTDYVSGDPTAANWTELSYNYPADNSQTWTESGEIDLSEIRGTNVHIAFKYVSSGTGTGTSSIWEIDDIRLQAMQGGSTTTGVLVASETSLTGFEYILGNGPSPSQSFTLSGTDLDGSAVTLTAPANYEISTDNSVFYATTTLTGYNGNDTTIYVRLKAGREAGQYNETLNITGGGATDLNLSLSGEVNSASLATSVTTLTGFSYSESSGPSGIKGFVLSGSYLDGNSVTVTAPDNFEISLDSVNFFSVLNINYTAPGLQDTVIVVRLKAGLVQGEYSGNLVCSDNGSAQQITVALSGNVNAASSTCGGLENFENLITGSSSYSSGSFTGQDGSTWSYTDSRTDQSIDGASICIRDGYLTSGEIAGGIGKITISTQRVYTGTDNSLTVEINGNSVGTVPYSDVVQTTTIENINISGNFTLKISTPGNGDRVVVDNITWTCYPEPTNTYLTASKSSLTGLDYLEGNGPSQAQSITISGKDLDGSDVEIIAPTDFEVSLDASTYASSQTLSAYDGSNTIVYVRLKAGLPKASYSNEIMEVRGGGAETVSITLNGEVYSPYFTISTENIFGFSYYLNNGPSDAKTFVLSGAGLDGTDVTITAPSDFEISLDGTSFSSTVVLNAYDGTETTIYARLAKDLSVGVYSNEILTISGGGAETKAISLNGEVLAPYFTVSPAKLYNFSYYLNAGPSEAQTFVLSGTGLDGSDVTITAPSDFEISLDGNNFSNSQTLSNYDGTETTVHARLKQGLTVGTYSAEEIQISGGSANNIFVPLYGEVHKPFLTINPTVLSGFSYMEGSGPSDAKSFELTGTGISNTDITITATTNYEVAEDNTNFSNTLDIIGYNGQAKTIYVRLKSGLNAGDYNNENIEISGSDLETVYVSLNGSVTEFTNIEQNTASVKVFPNPVTNDNIRIKTPANTQVFVQIYSVNGQIVYSAKMASNGEISIDFKSPKGIYMIKILTDDGVYTSKLIKL